MRLLFTSILLLLLTYLSAQNRPTQYAPPTVFPKKGDKIIAKTQPYQPDPNSAYLEFIDGTDKVRKISMDKVEKVEVETANGIKTTYYLSDDKEQNVPRYNLQEAEQKLKEKSFGDLARSVIQFEPINFASGKTELPKGGKEKIEKVAMFMKTWPQVQITIVGHTDSKGNPEENLKLSMLRAANVMFALTNAGIASNRILSGGRGQGEPISDNDSENRRVEFKLTIPNVDIVYYSNGALDNAYAAIGTPSPPRIIPLQITINASEDFESPNDGIIKQGGRIALEVRTNKASTEKITYLWSTGDSTSKILLSPKSSKTYRVTVTGGNNDMATASFKVTIKENFPFPVIQDRYVYFNVAPMAGKTLPTIGVIYTKRNKNVDWLSSGGYISANFQPVDRGTETILEIGQTNHIHISNLISVIKGRGNILTKYNIDVFGGLGIGYRQFIKTGPGEALNGSLQLKAYAGLEYLFSKKWGANLLLGGVNPIQSSFSVGLTYHPSNQ